jgi:glycosyltransferase involved in cell wall biosynthesis
MGRRITFSNYDDLRNPFYGGGGARAIHEVARRLAPRHAVRVLTAKYPGSRDELIDGVQYVRVGCEKAGPKTGQLWFQLSLPRWIRRGGFEVWVESLTPPFSTACLQWFTQRPVVALTQVLAGRAMGRKYWLPFGTLERLGLKTYRYAVATSEYLKGQLLAANPRLRLVVIPNGVDAQQIARPVAKDEAHILFLGRLDVRQKGLDLLLEALAAVRDRLELPVLIAGSGSPRDEAFVRRRLGELQLQNQARAVGRVDGRVKEELLRQAAFVLMPSRFEASPLVALEAFCHQTPLVAFAIPELAELPDECVVKVAPFDTAALGQAMVELSRDSSRRARMGQAAKDFVRRFDWDDLARRYEDFLETIMQQAGGGPCD